MTQNPNDTPRMALLRCAHSAYHDVRIAVIKMQAMIDRANDEPSVKGEPEARRIDVDSLMSALSVIDLVDEDVITEFGRLGLDLRVPPKGGA